MLETSNLITLIRAHWLSFVKQKTNIIYNA